MIVDLREPSTASAHQLAASGTGAKRLSNPQSKTANDA
jgi:hypothetical protein